MKKIFLIIVLFVSVGVSAFGQTDSKYRQTLKKMFEVSGSEESYQTAIKQLFTMYKQQYPNVDPSMWDDFEKEFTVVSIKELTEMLVPVYSKYLSIDDLQDLIKFYETPVGKKFAKSTPPIMQESMQIGQQWGMKMAQDFQKKMKEKGY